MTKCCSAALHSVNNQLWKQSHCLRPDNATWFRHAVNSMRILLVPGFSASFFYGSRRVSTVGLASPQTSFTEPCLPLKRIINRMRDMGDATRGPCEDYLTLL